jgi:pimeloyl-ACP methyl ester carboxylesterase
MAGAQPVPAGKLFLEVAGSGSPTVVRPWRTVFRALAGFTRVVAYDRAGYGGSEPSSAPRSFDQVATELHAALGASGIAPPYILVGHSLGGAYIRAFAHLFKNEVAGLVFVDPFSEDAFSSAEVREAAIREQESHMAGAGPGLQAEWAFMKEETRRDFSGLRALGRPPDVPMAVLIARRDRPPKWVTALLAQYGPWVADAAEAQLTVVVDSGHYIQADDPQAVVAAVRRVVFPSVPIAVERALASGGAPAAIDAFRRMKTRYPAEYVSERTLNALGYRRLGAGQADDAIALFKLNVEAFPDSANAYDSLGEGYATKGDREAAIASYRKSLALDPANTGAVQALRKLEEAREP